MVLSVIVYGPRGENVVIHLCDTEEQLKSITVLQLKEKIAEKLPYKELENLRLVYTDKCLDDDSSPLSAYGIQHMSIIQMVMIQYGGGGPEEPGKGDGGMGDKGGKNRSMERLTNF